VNSLINQEYFYFNCMNPKSISPYLAHFSFYLIQSSCHWGFYE